MIDILCGQSGIITQIINTQKVIKGFIDLGALEILAIKAWVSTLKINIKNLTDKKILKQRLQTEILIIITREIESNPDGIPGRLSRLNEIYRDGGESVNSAIRKVEEFIKDPINNPIDICNDIDNIVKYGNEVYRIATPSKSPDSSPKRDRFESFDIKKGLSKFNPIPRYDSSNISQLSGIAKDYVSKSRNSRIGPGSANQMAISRTQTQI
jgi:hypothetical protein